jgi:predicted DNA-binding transcriptional regulator AlpA
MMSPPIAALSIRDAAETSGIGRSTLYELIAQGRGPRVLKINRRSVILIEDRDRWLRSLARETATA